MHKKYEWYPVSNVQLCKYTLKYIQKTQLGYMSKLRVRFYYHLYDVESFGTNFKSCISIPSFILAEKQLFKELELNSSSS